MAKGKSSSGRQRIPIEKIPKKSHLQVTFSKRRSGLFKKASELCTLCGVEIAIIVFSPADKAFSFGHPEVESIIDRFLTRNSPLDSSVADHQLVEAHRNANIRDLNMQLTQLVNQLESERKRGEELDQVRRVRQRECYCWWESPIEELGLNELQQLKFSMEELKNNVAKQANKMLMEQTGAGMSSMNGANGLVGFYDAFDRKPEIKTPSALPNAYNNINFRYAYL